MQQLFSVNSGDRYLTTTVTEPQAAPPATGEGGGVFLGTWNTQAEFDDVRLSTGSGQVIHETFDAAAQRWRAEAGAWTVSNAVYRQTGSEQPSISRLSVHPGHTDYTLALRARKTGGTEGFLVGFRAVDSANYYWWNIGGWNNTRHAVEKSVNGARSVVGGDKTGRIEQDRWYDIRVEVAGTRIRCFLDGDLQHAFTDSGFAKSPEFAVSSVRDTKTGDVILKLVNGAAVARPFRVELAGAGNVSGNAVKTVLTGTDPMTANEFGNPRAVVPTTASIKVGKTFDYAAPAHSLTVIRLTAD